MPDKAIQEYLTDSHCWGCGPRNDKGLQLRSYWDGTKAVARWTPEPHFAAGPSHVLNGGIIAALLDCHTVCTALADAYQREGRQIGEGDKIWYVTGSLEVHYFAPTPIHSPLELYAEVTEILDNETRVEGHIHSQGLTRAEAHVLAVRIPIEWLEPKQP